MKKMLLLLFFPTILFANIYKDQHNTFFPVTVGLTWQYQTTMSLVEDPEVSYDGIYALEIEKSIAFSDGYELSMKEYDDLTLTYRFPVILVKESEFSIHQNTFLGVGSQSDNEYHALMVTLPFKLGDKQRSENWDSDILAYEKVTVPAGTFEAWKIAVIAVKGTEYTIVGDYWYAPHVGIVKINYTIPGWHVKSELTSSFIKE